MFIDAKLIEKNNRKLPTNFNQFLCFFVFSFHFRLNYGKNSPNETKQRWMKQYNIKKKEEVVEQAPQEEPNPLMRKKKTPEELAAEAEQEDLDDFTSKYFIHSFIIM